jgi:hypothetical protein
MGGQAVGSRNEAKYRPARPDAAPHHEVDLEFADVAAVPRIVQSKLANDTSTANIETTAPYTATRRLPHHRRRPSLHPRRIHFGDTLGHRARRGRLRDDRRRAKCVIYLMPGGRLELPRPCGQRLLRPREYCSAWSGAALKVKQPG